MKVAIRRTQGREFSDLDHAARRPDRRARRGYLAKKLLPLSVAAFFSLGPVAAQNIEQLRAVAETVTAMCRGGTLEGSTQDYSIVVDGSVRTVILRGLAGVEGGAEVVFNAREWSGIEALVPETVDQEAYGTCVDTMTPLFLDKLNTSTGSVLERNWKLAVAGTTNIGAIWMADGSVPTFLARLDESEGAGSMRASVRLRVEGSTQPGLSIYDRREVAGPSLRYPAIATPSIGWGFIPAVDQSNDLAGIVDLEEMRWRLHLESSEQTSMRITGLVPVQPGWLVTYDVLDGDRAWPRSLLLDNEFRAVEGSDHEVSDADDRPRVRTLLDWPGVGALAVGSRLALRCRERLREASVFFILDRFSMSYLTPAWRTSLWKTYWQTGCEDREATEFTHAALFSDELALLGGRIEQNERGHYGVSLVAIDREGNTAWSFRRPFDSETNEVLNGLWPLRDGGILALAQRGEHQVIYVVDKTGDIHSGRRWNDTNVRVNDFLETAEGTWWFVGNVTTGGHQFGFVDVWPRPYRSSMVLLGQ